MNLCILHPNEVRNPNGKSIGSSVFVQLTAENLTVVKSLTIAVSERHGVFGEFDEFERIHCFTNRHVVRKFGRREIDKVVRYLPDTHKKNKISPRSPALASERIAPKICQGQLQTVYSECSILHPNRFTFVGVIAERVNTVRARSKVNEIFG